MFITRSQAAAQFEVTERTINNWDYRKTPAWALRMLQHQDRSLSGLHPDWAGFRIGWDGVLYGPHRLRVKAEHLRHEALIQTLCPVPIP